MKFLKEDFWTSANKFGFYVTLPCMLFKNIYQMDTTDLTRFGLVTYSVIALVLSIAVAWGISRLFQIDNRQRGAFIQGSFRTNFLILGLPLAESLFGPQGIAPTVILLVVSIPLFNVIAIVLLTIYQEQHVASISVKKIIKDVIKNPLMIATGLALVFVYSSLTLPLVIEKSIFNISDIATPLALIILGGQIDLSKVKGNLTLSLMATSLRVVFIPFCVIAGAILLGFRGNELGAIFILFSAPTAITSFVMAKNMGSDEQLAAQIVVLTTMVSIVTLPVGILVMKYFTLI